LREQKVAADQEQRVVKSSRKTANLFQSEDERMALCVLQRRRTRIAPTNNVKLAQFFSYLNML
jgi:hypothetical protein